MWQYQFIDQVGNKFRLEKDHRGIVRIVAESQYTSSLLLTPEQFAELGGVAQELLDSNPCEEEE